MTERYVGSFDGPVEAKETDAGINAVGDVK